MPFHAAPQPANQLRLEEYDGLRLIGVMTSDAHTAAITRVLLRAPSANEMFVSQLMPHVRDKAELEFDAVQRGWWMEKPVLERMPAAYLAGRPALVRARAVFEHGLGALDTLDS